MPRRVRFCENARMRDWAIDYILHVLVAKNWSANRLATEAGVAASTINRPLRDKNWSNNFSRTTLMKIQEASGIDPKPFIPAEMTEESEMFSAKANRTGMGRRPESLADRVLLGLDIASVPPLPLDINKIKIAVAGPIAQIVATVDRTGLARLRRKLDAIESMLEDD